MKAIVSFSGGKDSTAMLLMMIEKNIKIDEIVFIDTGVEFPEMYTHIKKVEIYIKRKITIIKAEKTFDYYLGEHVKRNGNIGYGWSDFKNRWCTQVLKKSPMKKYLKRFDNVIEYHGIAFDEIERTFKNNEKNIQYPLVDWKITEKEALYYCYDRGFDWEGLYEKFTRVSCYLCPLSRLNELKTVYEDYPKLWNHMKELDKKSFRRFRKDYTLEELEIKFKLSRFRVNLKTRIIKESIK